MPRQARLFESAGGFSSRALSKLQGNIPPNWIARARKSRKSIEPDLAAAIRKVKRLSKRRPDARATIRAAEQELRTVLRAWEVAYQKETFYYGLRALLEISRNGETSR